MLIQSWLDQRKEEEVAVYRRGNLYWYKFRWLGELIRESTKQRNKAVARQMEAAHRTALAKGEVGIRDKKAVPTLAEFAERDFLPHIRSTFAAKEKTRRYYENGVHNLLAFERLAHECLNAISTDRISEYAAVRLRATGRKGRSLQISTLNRDLQVLRRMFRLAEEWGIVDKALPTVRMLPGETHRERVLTPAEEALYFAGAESETMEQHRDPGLLRDVAAILLDCGLRPEECNRLRPENVRDGVLEVRFGKTENARRRIPMTARVKAILEMRLATSPGSEWIFPAPTKTGHIEPSSLKKQHASAIAEATRILRKGTGSDQREFEGFEFYTLRHTCLTRWAPHMDPWTLAYLAGHRDMSTTKRYVHPQEQTTRQAIERAREAVVSLSGGHRFGHTQGERGETMPEGKQLIQ